MKNFLNRFDEFLAVVVLGFMTALAFVNIVSRYWFHASISFTEEITTALFVLLSVIGVGIAAQSEAHLGLGLVTDRLPKEKRAYLAFAGNLLSAGFSVVLAYYGLLMVINQIRLKQITITLQLPEWIYGSFIPLGACYMFYRFLKTALRSLHSARR